MIAVLLLGWAATASAVPLANNIVPFTLDYTNPCTGETVTFTGEQNVVLTATQDSSGGQHLSLHDNWQNMQGVSSKGVKYRVPFSESVTINANESMEFSISQRKRVISQGASDNAYFFLLVPHDVRSERQRHILQVR